MDAGRRDRLQASLTRLAAGDRASFDEVFDVVWPVVRRFCERALLETPDAEDVAQEVLIRVLARASEYDKERPALPWILGIASWEMRTLKKKRMRRREQLGDLAVDLEPIDRSFEGTIIRRDLEAALSDVLGSLTAADVATILAAIGEADRPAIAPATFRKRFQRALGKLKSAWRTKHGTQ
jgi:RNA polymerase sigma-70 factor (ECF subfamily)